MEGAAMIAAAIFDLDGTLIDTGRGIVRMMTDTLHNMGVEPADETTIRSMIGLPLEVGLALFLGLPIDHPHVAVAVTKYKRRFHEWMVPQAADLLFPGVAEGLTDLRERGLKLGIATSKHKHSAEVILQSAAFTRYLMSSPAATVLRPPSRTPRWLGSSRGRCNAGPISVPSSVTPITTLPWDARPR
jgi:phosphoglycolate phosphatase